VTTLDFDFMFRSTAGYLKKLDAIAKDLAATLYRPHRFSFGMLRIQNEDYGLLVDFLPVVSGIRSFEGLRKRAKPVRFGNATLLVASLADIIQSKRSAGRPKITQPCLSWTKPVKKPSVTRKQKLLALKKDSGRAERDMIRRLLPPPPERRTHFLRRLIGVGGSSCP
jgi:hypothetical protein